MVSTFRFYSHLFFRCSHFRCSHKKLFPFLKFKTKILCIYKISYDFSVYPVVPAPIQAREIQTIQQPYMDERMHVYQPITTYAAPPPPPQNIVTVLKNEPNHYELKNGLHHTSFQNPMIENGYDHNGKIDKSDSPMRHHINGMSFILIITIIKIGFKFWWNQKCCGNTHRLNSFKLLSFNLDARKKDRRKVRASSLESSAESESSAMETGDGNSGQVAAISSTASFKSPAVGMCEEESNGEKQVNTHTQTFFH